MTHVQLVRLVGSLLFGGLGLVCLGLFVLMVYEVVAINTRVVPTISEVSSFELLRHPRWWIVIACASTFVVGALITHFAHWTPVPVP